MNNDDETNTSKKPAPAGPRKVFDVMRPGKALAASNSRNVIVGHKPQVKEDMFVAGPHTRLAGNPNEKRDLMNPSEKVSVSPLAESTVESSNSDAAKQAATETMTQAPEPDAPALTPQDEEAFEEASEPATAPAMPEEHHSDPDVPATAEPEPAPESAATKIDPEDRPTPQKAALSQTVEHPLDDKPTNASEDKHPLVTDEDLKAAGNDDILAQTTAPNVDGPVVSHHKHHTKWWEWVLIFLLIVVLAVVALNFLLDAEVLTTDLDLPYTDLIK